MNTGALWTTSLNPLLERANSSLMAQRGFETFRVLETPFSDLYLGAVTSGNGCDFINAARIHPLYEVGRRGCAFSRSNWRGQQNGSDTE